MTTIIRLAVACLLFTRVSPGNAVMAQERPAGFSKTDFYNAMQSASEEAVNKQLEIIKTTGIAGKDAFEGALLMKKAGLINGPKKKLDLFKAGHRKLESILQKDSSNLEFRFLRLMVQEHAPGILGYKAELTKDRLFIITNFEKLSPIVQQAIKDYSKESKVLKPKDFNSIR